MDVLNRLADGNPQPSRQPNWTMLAAEPQDWMALGQGLARGEASLLGLWGDRDGVRMALFDPQAGKTSLVGLACANGRFPSIAGRHPPAGRLERTIRDLYNLIPEGGPDSRPWLDHGCWGHHFPLAEWKTVPAPEPPPYPFLPSEGTGLHRIPVGPVHAGIIEPGHFRFTVNGETVVRLEERLGYVHKGIAGLMHGLAPDKAARLAGRASGDSTVAYALAFARASEAALGIEVPPRAVWLRALMAELERLANHLGDIGAICNDAAFAALQARFAILRERVLRACRDSFGHRLMMDRIVPGGVSIDLHTEGGLALRRLVAETGDALPALVASYDNAPSLQDRTCGTGHLKPALARLWGAGGYVGRASGRDFDARRDMPYPPYPDLGFKVPGRETGDVNARVWQRIDEAGESLSLIGQILQNLPGGAVRAELPASGGGEGVALIEGFRGDILAWVAYDEAARIRQSHLRDPSCFQWPLLEAVIEGNIVADFPLCNKSFNCSYSGHDL